MRPESSPAEKFDEYADQYEALHATSIAASGESTEYFARYKLECLVRLGAPRDRAVLDYGCGIGNLTEQLVGAFADVHAFDPSAKSLAVARRRAPNAVFYDRPEQIPIQTFETVVLSGVLHHVPVAERRALLDGVRRSLAPGGRVVIFEHNPLNPLTQSAVKNCPFDDDAVLLFPREAQKLLRSSGFEDVRLDYIVFFPRALSRLRPLEPKLGWLFLGAQMMLTGTRADV